jgi:hypothetical protein
MRSEVQILSPRPNLRHRRATAAPMCLVHNHRGDPITPDEIGGRNTPRQVSCRVLVAAWSGCASQSRSLGTLRIGCASGRSQPRRPFASAASSLIPELPASHPAPPARRFVTRSAGPSGKVWQEARQLSNDQGRVGSHAEQQGRALGRLPAASNEEQTTDRGHASRLQE